MTIFRRRGKVGVWVRDEKYYFQCSDYNLKERHLCQRHPTSLFLSHILTQQLLETTK